MNCEEARNAFDDRLDGALPEGELRAFEEHRAACGGCRAAFEDLAFALSSIREAPLLRTPASFDAEVLGRIRAGRGRPSILPRLLPYAAAASLAAALGAFLANSGLLRGASPAPADASPPAPAVAEARPPRLARGAAQAARDGIRRASVSPALPLDSPATSDARAGIPWAALAKEGVRFLAATNGLLERAALEAAAPLPAPSPAAAPVRPASPAAAGERPLPSPVEPAGSTVLVRRGDETLLFSAGPPEKEIPALLGILRDQGGRGAELALARLRDLSRDLSSRGLAREAPREERAGLLDRLGSSFSSQPEDDRTRAVAGWERWWSESRPAIVRVARADT